MNSHITRAAKVAGALAGLALMAGLTGCVLDGSGSRGRYRATSAVSVPTSAVVVDDFDYFPGYEIYYSRSRQEYVYREGRSWVRRPAPRGVTVDVLFASPSVRLDFHDAPSRHHHSVVKSYPRSWSPPVRDDAVVHQPDRWNDKKSDAEERRERK